MSKTAADAQARLDELRIYLAEYRRHRPTATDAQHLQNHSAFLARLGEAERFQAGVAHSAVQASTLERGRWLEHRRELERLDRLASLYRARQRLADDRRAQKLMDEFAQRRAAPKDTDDF
jgi:flagellar protein FliJ